MIYSLDVINLAITHLITTKSKKDSINIKFSDNILNMKPVIQKSSKMLHKINKYLNLLNYMLILVFK